jgi:hypothetical protein
LPATTTREARRDMQGWLPPTPHSTLEEEWPCQHLGFRLLALNNERINSCCFKPPGLFWQPSCFSLYFVIKNDFPLLLFFFFQLWY